MPETPPNDFGFCNGEQILWSDIDKATVGPVFHKNGRAYRSANLLPNSRFGNPVLLPITVDWSLKPYPVEIAGQILFTGLSEAHEVPSDE